MSASSLAVESVNMKHSQTGSWKKHLRTGQILTTESTDPLQLFTLLGAEKFSPFVHIGIIEVVDKKIYVYDTTANIGKYYLEGKSPSDTMQGNVRRQELQSFLHYAKTINIFSPPPGVNTKKFIAFVKQHWIAKTPFDPYFNLSENTKLYCSEFIALAIKQAGGPEYAPATMRHNPSLNVVRRWMKIETPQFLFPYNLVEPKNWLGTISINFSKHGVLIDRLVKYELYRRFTSNQKIGNLLKLNGTEITVKEPIKRFASEAHKLSVDGLNALSQKIRKIADKTLGKASNIPREPLPHCQLDPSSCAAL